MDQDPLQTFSATLATLAQSFQSQVEAQNHFQAQLATQLQNQVTAQTQVIANLQANVQNVQNVQPRGPSYANIRDPPPEFNGTEKAFSEFLSKLELGLELMRNILFPTKKRHFSQSTVCTALLTNGLNLFYLPHFLSGRMIGSHLKSHSKGDSQITLPFKWQFTSSFVSNKGIAL